VSASEIYTKHFNIYPFTVEPKVLIKLESLYCIAITKLNTTSVPFVLAYDIHSRLCPIYIDFNRFRWGCIMKLCMRLNEICSWH